MHHRTKKIAIAVALMLAAFALILFLAREISENEGAQMFVEQFGYIGILAISIVSGLDIFVPIPAAAFTPVYVAAGFPILGIIIVLVIGTTIADFIGYLIGVIGKQVTKSRYPNVYKRLRYINNEHHRLILPFVFLYSALSPIPNEAILIPLAMMGFKFRVLIIPLFLGTIMYQSALAYGAVNIFDLLF